MTSAEVEEYFDALAQTWDERIPMDDSGREALGFSIDQLHIKPNHVILDAGCGTGVLTPFLLERIGIEGKIIGVDISRRMIARAQKRFAGDLRLKWLKADILAYLQSNRESWIDRIVCFSAFPHFPDKPAVLKAFYRALRPHGRFAVIHTKDSHTLNRFHASLKGTPVVTHRLPPAAELSRMACVAGFSALASLDKEGLYLAIGERG